MAELRARPDVRDAEALAAWIGRHKKAGTLGKMAAIAARKRRGKGDGGNALGSDKSSPKLPQPAASPPQPAAKKPSILDDDDDPFNEDFGSDEPTSKEDEERERYEAKILRDLEKAERSRVFQSVQENGGLQTRDDLREEYAGIPNTYKRRDGTPGDEMAEYLAAYYPEFGIEDERYLIDFLAA